MWLMSMVTQAGPVGFVVPPKNPPKSKIPGPQSQLSLAVFPGGTSIRLDATASKIGFS